MITVFNLLCLHLFALQNLRKLIFFSLFFSIYITIFFEILITVSIFIAQAIIYVIIRRKDVGNRMCYKLFNIVFANKYRWDSLKYVQIDLPLHQLQF